MTKWMKCKRGVVASVWWKQRPIGSVQDCNTNRCMWSSCSMAFVYSLLVSDAKFMENDDDGRNDMLVYDCKLVEFVCLFGMKRHKRNLAA